MYRDWQMARPTAPLDNSLQRSAEAIPSRLAHHCRPALARPAPVMSETQEVETTRLLGAMGPECNQARLTRMHGEAISRQPFRQHVQDPPRIVLIGESHHEVSRPGESHPQALAEPYVNVSAHTAPIIQSQAEGPKASSGQTAPAHDEQCRRANALPGGDAF